MNTVDIYRDGELLTTVKPDTDSSLSRKIMADDQVKLTFPSNQRIVFNIGDRATFFGYEYFLSDPPVETKESTVKYRYELTFKSTAYLLSRVQFLFLGDDNSLKEPDFSLTGTAKDFILLLMQNIKRLEPEFDFTTFEITNTDYRTISFNSVDCLTALGIIAEAFETEYFINGANVSLTKMGNDTGYTFKHGRQKGMYELTRKSVDNTQLITRIYPFGSDKNLPEGYRNYSKRLKMAPMPREVVSQVTISRANNGDGTYTYTFNWVPPNPDGATGVRILSRKYNPLSKTFGQWGRPSDVGLSSPQTYTIPISLQYQFKFQTIKGDSFGDTSGTIWYPKLFSINGDPDPSDNNPSLPLPVTEVLYLEKNIDKYGVHESTQIFEDVFPHRTGTVTSINAANVFQFHDSTIDFDLNDYLLPGMTAKVTFNTGQLCGYTFDIGAFDFGARRFTILKNKSERLFELPNTDLKPAIGDKYVITDISMPQSYIDAAETELKRKAQLLLDQYADPQISYNIVFDPAYLQKKNYNLNIGDLIWIVDDDMQVQKKMRIVSLTRKIVEEFSFEVEVSDVLSKTKIQALTSGQANLTSSVTDISKNIQNTSILNNRVVGDLIMTGTASIKFDGLQQKTGVSPVGIDAEGRLYRI